MAIIVVGEFGTNRIATVDYGKYGIRDSWSQRIISVNF